MGRVKNETDNWSMITHSSEDKYFNLMQKRMEEEHKWELLSKQFPHFYTSNNSTAF